MNTKQIEALKLALEAFKQIDEAMPFPVAKLAQKAIREALAQPEQETVLPGGGHVPAVPVAVYGYCPECGGAGVMRERRPNGDDKCTNGHKYPSSKALAEQPAQPKRCQCPACKIAPHASDCPVHNEPAWPNGLCDCGAQPEQEPVAWEGGEGWESLAWELCADENGEESCNELIWEGGPIPEPWGERWLKYEDEAKRLIALVQKHTSPPQRKPLTDGEILSIARNHYNPHERSEISFARAIEAKLREKNA